MERDCKNCIYHTEDGCTKWECEYVNKKEVAKLLVFCKDCKHYGIHKWSEGEYACCTNMYGAAVPRNPEDFCSQGERR